MILPFTVHERETNTAQGGSQTAVYCESVQTVERRICSVCESVACPITVQTVWLAIVFSHESILIRERNPAYPLTQCNPSLSCKCKKNDDAASNRQSYGAEILSNVRVAGSVDKSDTPLVSSSSSSDGNAWTPSTADIQCMQLNRLLCSSVWVLRRLCAWAMVSIGALKNRAIGSPGVSRLAHTLVTCVLDECRCTERRCLKA